MSTVALIVAGGSGERLRSTLPKLPKQYLPLPHPTGGSTTILRASIDAFLRHPGISQVCVVIADGDQELYQQATKGLALLPLVIGGATRRESVYNGLKALSAVKPDNVLIHDAARPFVSQEIISKVIAGLDSAVAVDLGIPLADTIKSTQGHIHTLPREQLYATQTPQGFRYSTISELHHKSAEEYTDDISLCLKYGIDVTVVEGDPANYKITTAQDYQRAQPNKSQRVRVGLGYDIHRFDTQSDSGHIMLGGAQIPCKHSIIAHSDGDVVLHALTDAIFGIIAAGDIGMHFPPSDPRWAKAPSYLFLQHAISLLEAKGGKVVHMDATIITEFPKILNHREKIIESLTKLLVLPADSVSIKAKTAEKLDAIGQGLAIAAQVVCCVEFS
ncbi:MAG: 2-C-methyl-D-erythritol 4-phosphate cytidylyltransferase [Proteobacteria bacterium]|nr:2-C-methyl-D-erythritol 4-phosphate cytidylyltransferase [Pseudomonadota bacterium]